MKFRNIGQMFLATVVSLGLCLGVTSCSNSFTVGFLYVTAVSTSNGATGQISGYKINNNTGQLTFIKNGPFGSGGINPIRAVIFPGGRFMYVLNQKASDTAGGNIALFTIGATGVLSYQTSYSSQGVEPVSIAIGNNNANFLYVLDRQVQDKDGNVVNNGNGAITAFTIDTNTGRLSLVENQQVINADGSQLPYFPVGFGPVAFGPINNSAIVGAYVYTVDADQSVFPYQFNPLNGQLTVTQNGPQPTGATNITVIGGNSAYVYLLDSGTTPSSILPYKPGTGGILQTVTSGTVLNDPTVTNPSDLVVDSKGVRLYISNAGPNTNPTNPSSAITAFSTGQLTEIGGSPFAAGTFPSGPQPVCILEDPSNQYIYTGNAAASTVTGGKIDSNTGVLTALPRGSQWATVGNPTWCVATGVPQ
jgi:6-phosphogluconolactonase